nr:hypothetical protein [Angustibacter aerolatus]
MAGSACAASTVGASSRSRSEAARRSASRLAQRRLVVAAHHRGRGRHPHLPVPAGDVLHEVLERLRQRGAARPAQARR